MLLVWAHQLPHISSLSRCLTGRVAALLGLLVSAAALTAPEAEGADASGVDDSMPSERGSRVDGADRELQIGWVSP
jgi:phosphate-selective porin